MVTTERHLHNGVKVRALYYLYLLERFWPRKYCPVRVIAEATGSSPDSLHVLLGRWSRWRLVKYYVAGHRSYCLASNGRRYLAMLGEWFPECNELFRAVCSRIGLAICWRTVYDRDGSEFVCGVKAPFTSAEDYFEIHQRNTFGRFDLPIGSRRSVKVESAFAAYNLLNELEVPMGAGLLHKLCEGGLWYVRSDSQL